MSFVREALLSTCQTLLIKSSRGSIPRGHGACGLRGHSHRRTSTPLQLYSPSALFAYATTAATFAALAAAFAHALATTALAATALATAALAAALTAALAAALAAAALAAASFAAAPFAAAPFAATALAAASFADALAAALGSLFRLLLAHLRNLLLRSQLALDVRIRQRLRQSMVETAPLGALAQLVRLARLGALSFTGLLDASFRLLLPLLVPDEGGNQRP